MRHRSRGRGTLDVRRVGQERQHPHPALSNRVVAGLLALPVVDRALGLLLCRPRLLQGVVTVMGAVLVVLALAPLDALRDTLSSARGDSEVPLAQAAPTHDAEAVMQVIAAYNQASITAAVIGRMDPMTPYLAPDSPAWVRVQTAYQQRAARRETHTPTLTRWGVLRSTVNTTTATLETQEAWDDVLRISGQVRSSRRGMVLHTTYTLQRTAAIGMGWRVTDVTSTVVVP